MTALDRVSLIKMYVNDHKGAGYLEILTYLNEIEEELYRMEDLEK